MTERPAGGGSPSGASTGDVRCDGGRAAGALFEALPDPVLGYEVRDGTPVVTAANPAYRETFGESSSGDTLDDWLATDLRGPPDEAAPEDSAPLSAATGAAAAGRGCRTAVRARVGDRQRDYILRVVPRDGSGGYVVLTDVTTQRDHIRTLTAERDRLDEFASIVSHDLRNPLEVAKVRLDAAERSGESVHFRKVEDAHERMERIIDDVLTLARQGQVIDEMSAVDLGAVAREAWETVNADAARLSVRTDARVEADADRLQELFENLFRNAVVHVGEDVTVAVGDLDNGFFVEDDGPGIPDEHRDEVFEPAVSTREDGTGLGLSIVDSIADAHGWWVSLADPDEKTAGGGARFEFTGVRTV